MFVKVKGLGGAIQYVNANNVTAISQDLYNYDEWIIRMGDQFFTAAWEEAEKVIDAVNHPFAFINKGNCDREYELMESEDEDA